MSRILIVDDEEQIRNLLSRLLEMNGYQCVLAANTTEARKSIQEQNFELVLCDVNMPGESGVDYVRYLLSHYPDTAAVMVTAMDDPAFAEAAMEIGAYGYIIKPFKHNEVVINVANALRRRKLEIQNRAYREDLEKTVLDRTEALQAALKGIQKTMEGVIHAMALTIETRDPYTAGHQERVTDLALAIIDEMDLSENHAECIRMAGMIHDIGKIAVPAELLSKPGDLTETEFNLIKTHPSTGFHILKDIDFPHPIAQIVHQHHERMDGSGYPQGLSMQDILIEARIIAVADVVEAMASHRPYRPSLGTKKALDEISQHRGTFFDPAVVDACLRLFHEKGFKFEKPTL